MNKLAPNKSGATAGRTLLDKQLEEALRLKDEAEMRFVEAQKLLNEALQAKGKLGVEWKRQAQRLIMGRGTTETAPGCTEGVAEIKT